MNDSTKHVQKLKSHFHNLDTPLAVRILDMSYTTSCMLYNSVYSQCHTLPTDYFHRVAIMTRQTITHYMVYVYILHIIL